MALSRGRSTCATTAATAGGRKAGGRVFVSHTGYFADRTQKGVVRRGWSKEQVRQLLLTCRGEPLVVEHVCCECHVILSRRPPLRWLEPI